MDPDTGVRLLPLGAILQALPVNGHNTVISFDTPDDYLKYNSPYAGETIGRYANRISDAQVSLNGKVYKLEANDGPNSIHGGRTGWGKKVWQGPLPVSRQDSTGKMRDALKFSLTSKHMEEGFPGTVEARAYYFIDHSDDKTTAEIEFEAELVGDEVEETCINLTNHSYFNPSASTTVAGTTLVLGSNKHLTVNEHSIPDGRIVPFPDSQVQPGAEMSVTSTSPVIDHCFILDDDLSKAVLDTRSKPYQHCATIKCSTSGASVKVETTEPAFQCYTGDGLDLPAVGSQPARGARSGIAIEPSRPVNAINMDKWKHMVILKKGSVYGSRIRYTAWQG